MLDTVEINHVQHISFAQSRLTDAVSVILSELLSYEHPSNVPGAFLFYADVGDHPWHLARSFSQFSSTFCWAASIIHSLPGLNMWRNRPWRRRYSSTGRLFLGS